MTSARRYLYNLVSEWERVALSGSQDNYCDILDEVLFDADLRFIDYLQYRDEGEFPSRLQKWLDNLSTDRDKKILFMLLHWIIFVDRLQMHSLYRDAYRRVVVPWISQDVLNARDMLSDDYDIKIRSLLRDYPFYSITESFGFNEFLHINNLHGLTRPIILGESKEDVNAKLRACINTKKGIIILEDFVGTGNQARDVLVKIKDNVPSNFQILFVPLLILECGLTKLNMEPKLKTVSIKPVMTIRNRFCLQKASMPDEPPVFNYVRSLIKSTADRVIRPLGDYDDPPSDPFGYGSSGALLVTCHNTPNNTLPLIHHRSPTWSPLFRRLHHSKDSLR